MNGNRLLYEQAEASQLGFDELRQSKSRILKPLLPNDAM
jgi:hypothetical protein